LCGGAGWRGADPARGTGFVCAGDRGGRAVPAGGAAGGDLPGCAERNLFGGAVSLRGFARDTARVPRGRAGTGVPAEGLRKNRGQSRLFTSIWPTSVQT